MMPERHPEKVPGHLDIDAVSAYVDRDFDPADLATIEFHLAKCPPCRREVLEIRTTVLLLGSLPQYEPRRSFCLGQEHARAARRRAPQRLAPGAVSSSLPASQVSLAGAPGPLPAPASGGWLPALHVAALVTGVLLLLVTVGDLTGFTGSDQPALQLAVPTGLAETPAPPQAAMPAPAPTDAELADVPAGSSGEPAAPGAAISAFQEAPESARGTDSLDSASEGVPEGEELARQAPRLMATSAAVAAVTRAMPTPGVAQEPAGEPAPGSAVVARAANDPHPSPWRLVQLALALILAWLVVSIAGLRWVRRAR